MRFTRSPPQALLSSLIWMVETEWGLRRPGSERARVYLTKDEGFSALMA